MPRVVTDPRGVDPRGIDLDVSRHSQASTISSVTLGGESYPIGTRVGSSGLFVIGDPHLGVPRETSSARTSQMSLNQTGSGNYLISERYYFEEWNWPVIRFSCLGVLIALMVGLLASIIALGVQGQTACHLNLEWWQGTFLYHIRVPEFFDSDKNGFGDIKGVQDRIDYLKYLNVKVVCLNQFLPSVPPYFEAVTSFRDVDRRVGTKDDIQALANALHKEDMRLLLEIRPAWTADEHNWFIESRAQSSISGNIYKGLYVWRNSRPRKDPWMWELSTTRNMYYKHLNDSKRPMINWANGRVADQLAVEMAVWLELGVDGFYLSGSADFHVGPHQYGAMLGYLQQWQELLAQHKGGLGGADRGSRRVLMLDGAYLKGVERIEPSILQPILQYVQLVDEPLQVSSNNLTFALQAQVKYAMLHWQAQPATWVSFKVGRFTGYIQQEVLPVLQTLITTLPGTPALHAGQEVGRDPYDTSYTGWRVRLMQWTKPGTGRVSRLSEAASKLDVTDIDRLRIVTALHESTPTLRVASDGRSSDDARSGCQRTGTKNAGLSQLGLCFIDVDSDVMLIKRHFYKRESFFYALNLGKEAQVRDWSAATSLGNFVTETSGKIEDRYLDMYAFNVNPSQGILFKVPM